MQDKNISSVHNAQSIGVPLRLCMNRLHSCNPLCCCDPAQFMPPRFGGNPAPFHAELWFGDGHLEIWMSNPAAVTAMPRTKAFGYSMLGDIPSDGYLGFTAGVGGLTNTHLIDNVIIAVWASRAVIGPDGSLSLESFGGGLWSVHYTDDLVPGAWHNVPGTRPITVPHWLGEETSSTRKRFYCVMSQWQNTLKVSSSALTQTLMPALSPHRNYSR